MCRVLLVLGLLGFRAFRVWGLGFRGCRTLEFTDEALGL